jgi:glycosyltransferase involved in cell wall biosynthesis
VISKDLSKKVLSIGCDFDPPKGGIAQVLYTYKKEVYSKFRFIPNSCDGNIVKKLFITIIAYLRTLLILHFNSNIKIVHIHTASYISFKRSAIFVKLSKQLGRHVVIHVHGGGFRDYYKTNPTWIKTILDKCDRIVALTPGWQLFFQEIGCQNVFVVNNIIPNPTFLSVKRDSMIHLLFMGWIVKEKGIFDLVEIIAEHKKECEGKMILHVGGDHEVEKLKGMILNYHLENIIIYEGWVSGENKIRLLNLMDAFILPSYTEGLPISILESLSYGKPVITTPVGGIPELVNEGNGFLFTPGNKQEMWEIIKTVINNLGHMNMKKDPAMISVNKNLPDSVVEQLNKVYEGLS